jgi:putative transposase
MGGRHKSSLIQSKRYLLTCYRYIELNPVRAGMVEQPEEFDVKNFEYCTNC